MTRPKLKARARELLEYAEDLGWEFHRHTGTGHLQLKHENGCLAIISSTPSDKRGEQIKKSELRRVARHGRPQCGT